MLVLKMPAAAILPFSMRTTPGSPTSCGLQLVQMQKNNWPLSYTGYTHVNPEGQKLNEVGIPLRLSYHDLLKTNYIGCSTAIYDTKALSRVYMPNLRKRQDYGLWLRILKKNTYAYGINEPLTIYLIREDSLSSNERCSSAYNWQLYRHKEGPSVILSLYYFTHYTVRGQPHKPARR